eukprot:TRINITY_DN12691_c0_g2_i1.p1 TRINITY_DN12691_c0_g2~~TRINITY_DN12691_c0_g2_i1.p1  ORF type:complete len:141 (+),score=17.96 TRINITY_DN12691_c0_g2_i1:412-834(+)
MSGIHYFFARIQGLFKFLAIEIPKMLAFEKPTFIRGFGNLSLGWIFGNGTAGFRHRNGHLQPLFSGNNNKRDGCAASSSAIPSVFEGILDALYLISVESIRKFVVRQNTPSSSFIISLSVRTFVNWRTSLAVYGLAFWDQ